jgi:methyl-accepting chemotaxis protein
MKPILKLSTRAKMLIGFGIIIASIIATLIFARMVGLKIKSSQETMIVAFKTSKELTQLRSDENRLRALILEMVLTRDNQQNDSLHLETHKRMAEVDARLNTIGEWMAGSPANMALLDEIMNMMKTLKDNQVNLLNLIDQGKYEEAGSFALRVQNPFYETIRQKIRRLEGMLQDDMNLMLARNNSLFRNFSTELTLFSVIIIMIVLVFTVALFRLVQKISAEIKSGLNIIGTSTNEILTTVNEVFTGATETASAVSETTTTIGEIRQTALVATQRAQTVLESSQHASEAAENGKESVRQTIAGMNHINEQMNQIARSVIKLSDQNRSIGEITATVTDIAEQSNLLAVNAAIEAAKAGEHGRGFSVVAQEIRSLAEQSKQATLQVKEILSEIQKSINLAVMSTEQGSKAVEQGNNLALKSGEMIDVLAESVNEAVQSVMQISISSQQQMAGIDQIVPAMDNIKLASKQNVVGTRQTQNVAQTLNELGQNLKKVIEKYQI